MNQSIRRNLVVSLPIDMYNDFKKRSDGMGQTLSEMTREMIMALLSGNLRIKRDLQEYERRVELGRQLYSAD